MLQLSFFSFSVNVSKFAEDYRFYVNLHLHVQGNVQSRLAMANWVEMGTLSTNFMQSSWYRWNDIILYIIPGGRALKLIFPVFNFSPE